MKKKFKLLFTWTKALLFVMVCIPWNWASAQNLVFLGQHEGHSDGSYSCVGEDTYCTVIKINNDPGPDIRIENSALNYNSAMHDQIGNSITVTELNSDSSVYRITTGVLSGFTATDEGDSTTTCTLTWQ